MGENIKKHSDGSDMSYDVDDIPIDGEVAANLHDDSAHGELDTCSMDDVEVFRSGVHNKVEYTDDDLDQMIAHFNNRVVEPYIKVGHEEKQPLWDEFALGWVSALRRSGDKLIASFKQVPKKLALLIQSGALKKKSIEILQKYRANGNVYDNVLRAVAFFGANGTPAVSGLNDFVRLYKASIKRPASSESALTVPCTIDSFKSKEYVMEIEQGKYEELVAFKSQCEKMEADATESKTDIEKLKADIAKFEAEKAESEKKNKGLEAEKDGLAGKLKKLMEESEKNEAEGFVNDQEKKGKSLPAHHKHAVESYKRAKMAGEDALKSHMEECESRVPHVDIGGDTHDEPDDDDEGDDDGEDGKDGKKKFKDMPPEKLNAIRGTHKHFDIAKMKAANEGQNYKDRYAQEKALNDDVIEMMKAHPKLSFPEAYKRVYGKEMPGTV